MIEENKRVKSSTLLLEMWAMANHSTSVMRMLDTFYAREPLINLRIMAHCAFDSRATVWTGS
jgi:hypothetical protein